ncbi:hypothetical protein GCM10007079_46070 [Nocardiopsis terrae]|uniref:Type VII secretion system protein EssD-like domain-containing protein n=1 Tax=Nocardiopsis terrae TaxID=372655 RepID=A0ABR9HKN9_9ACTN|nr:DNA/RNA non-specific endonuclease [Nocardiopsis terrae]MBE1459586.1 hypothetical protein [Nocardiopsis terrae]GHC94975.1 hypothetical protein GCM10007079_46070 [Nocardiopsis terrae]
MPTDEQPSLTDGDNKIDPSLFPVPETMTHVLEIRAAKLRTGGVNMSQNGDDIVSAWDGLSECYSAPEAEELYSALAPVTSNGAVIELATERVASALETFAETVREIQADWRSLKTEANAFLAGIAGDDEWDKPDHLLTRTSSNVEENDRLHGEAEKLIAAFEEAERDCANKINIGIVGRTDFLSGEEAQGKPLGPNAFVYDTVNLNTDIPSTWGDPAGADTFWYQDVGDAVWDFGVGAAEDVGAMVGAHSSQGWFNQSWGDALKEYHWDNLTSAASLVGMYDAESDSLGWSGLGSAGEAWKDLAHSVVPWEEWGERPGYVIGTALLNIGATVGGAALTATGVGAVVGVPLMLWRGAAVLDGMGSSGRGGSGMDVDLPELPEMPAFGGNGAPVVPVDLSNLDTSGFSPEQLNEMRASLDRIAVSHGADSETSPGGGRPSQPRPGQSEASYSSQRSPSSAGADPEEARVGDLALYEQIINHPENQEFDARVSQQAAPELQSVDRAAKTDPHGPAGSPESRWTASELLDEPDPRARELATTAPRPDADVQHAQSRGSQDQHLRVNDSEGARSDGDRAGQRDPRSEASPDGRESPRVQDRNPTATNQDGRTNSPGNAGDSHAASTHREMTSASIRSDSNSSSFREENNSGEGLSARESSGLPERSSRNMGREGEIDFDDSSSRPQNAWDAPGRRLPDPDISKDPSPLESIGSDSDRAPSRESPFDTSNLDPNKHYKVYDKSGRYRGIYSTGPDGKIVEIRTFPGESGSWNPDLGNPLPRVNYIIDSTKSGSNKKFVFQTDASSRTVRAYGELDLLDKADKKYRHNNQQSAAGNEGKDYFDDPRVDEGNPKSASLKDAFESVAWNGGHLIGTKFGGTGHSINLFAQMELTNKHQRGPNVPHVNFRDLEVALANVLKNSNNRVDFEIECLFATESDVPTAIRVKALVNGKPPLLTTHRRNPDTGEVIQVKKEFPVLEYVNSPPIKEGYAASLPGGNSTIGH